MKKRDLSVNFVKAAACIGVVLCHCNFCLEAPTSGMFVSKLYTAFFADATNVFWLVTGFFFLQNKSYPALWKRTIRRVAVPGLLMILFTHYASPMLVEHIPFSESTFFNAQENIRFFLSILSLNETGIYWYVFAYLWVVFAFPVTKAFGDWLSMETRREITFLVITFGMLLMNDLFLNKFLHFDFSGPAVLLPASIAVLWGHIFYRHKDFLLQKKVALVSLICLVLSLSIRIPLRDYFIANNIDSQIASWFSVFGFLQAGCVTILLFHLSPKNETHPLHRVAGWISRDTYPLYLVHPFLISLARTNGFFDMLIARLGTGHSGTFYYLTALPISFLLIFTITTVIVVFLRKIVTGIIYVTHPSQS